MLEGQGQASAEVVLGASVQRCTADKNGAKISSKTETATLVECGLQPGKSQFVLELVFTPTPHERAILVSDCKSGKRLGLGPGTGSHSWANSWANACVFMRS